MNNRVYVSRVHAEYKLFKASARLGVVFVCASADAILIKFFVTNLYSSLQTDLTVWANYEFYLRVKFLRGKVTVKLFTWKNINYENFFAI